MSKILLLLMSLFSLQMFFPLVSCVDSPEVERVEVKYQLLSEDVFTRMPGNLLLSGWYACIGVLSSDKTLSHLRQ